MHSLSSLAYLVPTPLAIAALRSARRHCRTRTGVAEGHGTFTPRSPRTPPHLTLCHAPLRTHAPDCWHALSLTRGISTLLLLTPYSPIHHLRAPLHPPASHCATPTLDGPIHRCLPTRAPSPLGSFVPMGPLDIVYSSPRSCTRSGSAALARRRAFAVDQCYMHLQYPNE
ncbi:hypothetical protein B0H14DRAFT_2804929 [Mycena olivaceomarginata]|nr:hypothetical protein B0H14DRAFT_2804929 [Mycena olivaceomarginata]